MAADSESASPRVAVEAPAARRDAPPVQPDRPVEQPPAGRTTRPRSRWRPSLRTVLFALLPLALVGGAYWYVTGGRVVWTDDAYVEAETVGVSTDVSGIVKEVDVKENQHVDTGQVLYSLDPLQFQIALDSAKANLAETVLTIEAMEEDYKRMVSDADAQQAQVALEQITYNRSATLLHNGTGSQADYDQANYTLQTDKDKLASLRQQAAVQLAKLGGNASIPATQHPEYLQAKAQVDEAQRELNHTVVKAPFSGVVTDVPSTTPGKYLAASTIAFYLVDTDHLWVQATPKETQLTYVRPGQPVTVTIDTYPSEQWHGTVESISPAAAQEFSLLPAQNTSGNWVKVVQRIPMRIKIDTNDKNMPPLRAGMSAEVGVDTGHARGWPHSLSDL